MLYVFQLQALFASGNEVEDGDKAAAFANLVLSDEHGAVILEASPPKR